MFQHFWADLGIYHQTKIAGVERSFWFSSFQSFSDITIRGLLTSPAHGTYLWSWIPPPLPLWLTSENCYCLEIGVVLIFGDSTRSWERYAGGRRRVHQSLPCGGNQHLGNYLRRVNIIKNFDVVLECTSWSSQGAALCLLHNFWYLRAGILISKMLVYRS